MSLSGIFNPHDYYDEAGWSKKSCTQSVSLALRLREAADIWYQDQKGVGIGNFDLLYVTSGLDSLLIFVCVSALVSKTS